MIKELSRQPLALAAAVLLVIGAASSCGTGPVNKTAEPAQIANSGPVAAATIENLQAAFDGESNAANKYAAFAVQADRQGFAQVASLFRAAGKAEEIHAKNHSEVLRKMGAEPKADVKTPEVGTTAENLLKAIEGESYERDTMYPNFIRQARDAGNVAAVRTLNLAKSAETGHALLYQAALDSLKDGPSTATQFFVCPVCGFTKSGSAGMADCPACSTKMDEFIVVT
jgi:rubrerythrin